MNNFPFLVAGGSIPGRDHLGRGGLLIGKNNQDGFAWHQDENGLIAVVCDGCGSEPQSEVGAKLGARLVLAAISRRLKRDKTPPSFEASTHFWEAVRQDVLAQLRVLALELAGHGSLTDVIRQYFLFTVVAMVVTPEQTEIVTIGDGCFALNGDFRVLEPEPGNRPLYLAYGLIETEFPPESLRFRNRVWLPTAEVDTALIGSDGAAALANLEQKRLPGRDELVGRLDQFWTDDRFFCNSDALRRRLALINSEVMHLDHSRKHVLTDNGHLADDATLVVVRRSDPNP